MTAEIEMFFWGSDNFGALIHDPGSGRTASIDAPEAAPIEAALQRRGWRLTDLLITHHHGDHIAGVEALKAKWNCRVVAAAADRQRIPAVDEAVQDGDTVSVGALEAKVIDTPG